MKTVKPVKGLDWTSGAVGTAVWGGVLLKDVLEYAGNAVWGGFLLNNARLQDRRRVKERSK